MTDAQVNQAAELIVVSLVAVLLAVGGVSMLVGWIAKRLSTNKPSVTSSTAREVSDDRPLSVTADRQTAPDRPTIAKPTPEQMLDIFRVLRRHNVPRSEIDKVMRAAGLPFDNNIWSQAAPPPGSVIQTPIAGRTVDASLFRRGDPSVDVPAFEQPPR